MTDSNRIISARQPFLNNDGTVDSSWFRFLAALASQSGSDVQLILDESIDRQTDNDTAGLATQKELDDTDLLVALRDGETARVYEDAMLLAELADGGQSQQGVSAFDDRDVPYYIAPTETFEVPLYLQKLFAMNIDNEGILDVDGYLVEVDPDVPGAQGPQGFQGTTGAQGPQGFQGTAGSQGSQGFQGTVGAQGPQGAQGSVGAQGSQGSQGVQGAQGFQGTQGFQGVAGSQGASGVGDYVRIAQVVTSGSQATITFSSIPAGYTALKVTLFGRDTANVGDTYGRMKINGDATAANYSSTQYLQGVLTGAGAGNLASSVDGSLIFELPGVNANANAMGVSEITIMGYVNTTFHKLIQSHSSASAGAGLTSDVVLMAFIWKSTAAITSLTLTAPTTAFVDGSTATLYGLT